MLESARDLLPYLPYLPLLAWLARGIVAAWKTQARSLLFRWARRQMRKAWACVAPFVRYRILRRETPEARKRRETEKFIAYRERRREALRVVCPHVRVVFSEYSKERVERGEKLVEVTTLFEACKLISQETFLTARTQHREQMEGIRDNLYSVYFCRACDFGPVSTSTVDALAEAWQVILENEPAPHRQYLDDAARLVAEVAELNQREPVSTVDARNMTRSTLTRDELRRILKGVD